MPETRLLAKLSASMDNTGPLVFTGNANIALAKEIADYVGVHLGQATVTSFPNGETFVKINENIRGRTSTSSSRPRRRPTRT
ncbi:MAG: ribose-phosphate pyrophosphokinase-like domain-containing protein [Verrucomicrobiota bacterium]